VLKAVYAALQKFEELGQKTTVKIKAGKK